MAQTARTSLQALAPNESPPADAELINALTAQLAELMTAQSPQNLNGTDDLTAEIEAEMAQSLLASEPSPATAPSTSLETGAQNLDQLLGELDRLWSLSG